MLDFSTIGNNVNYNRIRCNLTQEELSEMLNVTPDYISKIESGLKRPSLSTLEKMANIFKMDFYELISDNSTDPLEGIDRELYNRIKDWEPETTRMALKAAEMFAEIDTVVRESKEND